MCLGALLIVLLTLAVVIGGIDMVTQSVALAKKPHIVIGM